jgi:hypothetical protein
MSIDRDRSLETLLRERHEHDARLSSVAQCVDAEVLAAWVDGALSGQALADAEKHAAGCARCQALLASIAKATPAVEPRPWWRAVSAKWLVPVAAAATALLVWVSVGSRPEPVTEPPSTSVAATLAERPALAPTGEAAPTAQNAQSLADRADRATELRKNAVLGQATRRAGAGGGRNTVAPPKSIDAVGKTADAISARPRAGSGGGIAGAPSPVQPPASSAPAATPAPASPPTRQEASTAVGGQPLPQPQAAAAKSVAESVKIIPELDAKPLAGAGGGIVALQNAPEIRSPQPDYRWRIVPPSRIQRSVDGGATWSVVDPVPVQGRAGVPALVLTTGSSPSRDVCWIVGRAGVVLVTTDGATWQRRAVPGSPDLTAVRAADDRAATVTTADGRQYATVDGGATWTVVK